MLHDGRGQLGRTSTTRAKIFTSTDLVQRHNGGQSPAPSYGRCRGSGPQVPLQDARTIAYPQLASASEFAEA